MHKELIAVESPRYQLEFLFSPLFVAHLPIPISELGAYKVMHVYQDTWVNWTVTSDMVQVTNSTGFCMPFH